MFKFIITTGILVLSLGLAFFPILLSKKLQLNFSLWWVRIIGILGLSWVALEFITGIDPNSVHLSKFILLLAVMLKHFTGGVIVGLLFGLGANRFTK